MPRRSIRRVAPRVSPPAAAGPSPGPGTGSARRSEPEPEDPPIERRAADLTDRDDPAIVVLDRQETGIGQDAGR